MLKTSWVRISAQDTRIDKETGDSSLKNRYEEDINT